MSSSPLFIGPLADTLQQLHSFPLLVDSDLSTVLQVGPHEGRVERDNHLPVPAGHPSSLGAQDTTGLPSCKSTLLCDMNKNNMK